LDNKVTPKVTPYTIEFLFSVFFLKTNYLILLNKIEKDGGERGIRTLGTVARTRDFQSRTIGHSVTSPLQICPEKSKSFPEHKFYLR
jgi:hypothetical protein